MVSLLVTVGAILVITIVILLLFRLFKLHILIRECWNRAKYKNAPVVPLTNDTNQLFSSQQRYEMSEEDAFGRRNTFVNNFFYHNSENGGDLELSP